MTASENNKQLKTRMKTRREINRTMAKDSLNRPVARFQIELLSDRMARVDRMLHLAGAHTKRELFEQALTIYEVLLEKYAEGKRMVFHGSNNDTEPFLFPPLENAKEYGRQQKPNGAGEPTPFSDTHGRAHQ